MDVVAYVTGVVVINLGLHYHLQSTNALKLYKVLLMKWMVLTSTLMKIILLF